MNNNLLIILFSVLISGCASSGSSTLYKTSEKFDIQKIGFVDLTLDTIPEKVLGRSSGPFQGAVSTTFKESSTKLVSIYTESNDIFRSIVQSSMKELGVDSIFFVREKIDYFIPDSLAIVNYCSEFKLDGIIVSKLKFIRIKETLFPFYITIARKYYSEIGMMLFDNQGKLVTSVLYSTLKGNPHSWAPKADKAVKYGTIGAINTMSVEINPNANVSKE